MCNLRHPSYNATALGGQAQESPAQRDRDQVSAKRNGKDGEMRSGRSIRNGVYPSDRRFFVRADNAHPIAPTAARIADDGSGIMLSKDM
jgi:hypothetical protein